MNYAITPLLLANHPSLAREDGENMRLAIVWLRAITFNYGQDREKKSENKTRNINMIELLVIVFETVGPLQKLRDKKAV